MTIADEGEKSVDDPSSYYRERVTEFQQRNIIRDINYEECPNETFMYTLKFVVLDGDRKLEFKGDTCRSISSAQESAAMKAVLFLGKLSIIIIMGLFFT